MARRERIMMAAWFRSQKACLAFLWLLYLQNPTRMARRERIMMAASLRPQKASLAFLWLLLPAEPHQDGKERENHGGGITQASKS
jgi:hypothetical protein